MNTDFNRLNRWLNAKTLTGFQTLLGLGDWGNAKNLIFYLINNKTTLVEKKYPLTPNLITLL
jgi:hypothetical protein